MIALFCPSCGTKLDSNSNFCPKCGYKLNGKKVSAKPAKPAEMYEDVAPFDSGAVKKKKKSKIKVFFLIVAILCIISLVSSCLNKPNSSHVSSSPKATAKPSATTTISKSSFKAVAKTVGESALKHFSEFDPSYSIDEQKQQLIITTNVDAKRSDFDVGLALDLDSWNNTIDSMLEYNKDLKKLFSQYGYDDATVLQDFGCYDDGSLIVIMDDSVVFDYAKYKGFK